MSYMRNVSIFPTTGRDVGCSEAAASGQGSKNKKSREWRNSLWWLWVLEREDGTKTILPNDVYRNF